MKPKSTEKKRHAAGPYRRTAAVLALAALLAGFSFLAAAEAAEGEKSARPERAEQAESRLGPIQVGETRLRLWVVCAGAGGFRINLLDGERRLVRTFCGKGSGGIAALEAEDLSPGRYCLEAVLPGGSAVIVSCQPEEAP